MIISADHETGATILSKAEPENGYALGIFASKGHTPMMVPLFAYGPRSREFSGIQENSDVANKIIAIARKGGAETREANLALREIALNGTPHSRLPAAKGINDPEIASDPEVVEAIERMEEADRRYENAMIASDSGLYTTG